MQTYCSSVVLLLIISPSPYLILLLLVLSILSLPAAIKFIYTCQKYTFYSVQFKSVFIVHPHIYMTHKGQTHVTIVTRPNRDQWTYNFYITKTLSITHIQQESTICKNLWNYCDKIPINSKTPKGLTHSNYLPSRELLVDP